MRLDRYLTLCDLGSRKEVKELIARGRVWMDGRPVRDAGMAVKGEVTVDGEPAAYRPLVAIVMNKPAGVLTATTDKKQKTVLDLLPDSDRRRDPAPVGRLDKDTTGLLLITQVGGGEALPGTAGCAGHPDRCGGLCPRPVPVGF